MAPALSLLVNHGDAYATPLADHRDISRPLLKDSAANGSY